MATACSDALSGRTILCLATQGWDAHWTPVQQVMLRLAPRNRVIVVEPFHPPLAWLKRRNSLLKRQREQGVPQLREIHDNLFVYRPSYWYLPGNLRSSPIRWLNGPTYKAEIARLVRRLDARKPWLWAFFAQDLSVLDLKFERFIYDCVDDWPPFFTNPAEHRFVKHVDEQLCRAADLVFVGSRPLQAKKAPFNAKTFVVNHAADVAHFVKATHAQTTIPSDLEQVPRPRIGFVGMMDSVRFDVDIISKIAQNSERHVVLIGGFLGGVEESLPLRPNIHRLGMKSVAELPGYLKGMDVCIMPYRLNEATRHIFPLKLFEYLATGRPLVTTAIPAVDEFRHLLYVADSPEDFIRLVDRALAEENPDLLSRRLTCAGKHTWEAHVSDKMELIARHLLNDGSRS